MLVVPSLPKAPRISLDQGSPPAPLSEVSPSLVRWDNFRFILSTAWCRSTIFCDNTTRLEGSWLQHNDTQQEAQSPNIVGSPSGLGTLLSPEMHEQSSSSSARSSAHSPTSRSRSPGADIKFPRQQVAQQVSTLPHTRGWPTVV